MSLPCLFCLLVLDLRSSVQRLGLLQNWLENVTGTVFLIGPTVFEGRCCGVLVSIALLAKVVYDVSPAQHYRVFASGSQFRLTRPLRGLLGNLLALCQSAAKSMGSRMVSDQRRLTAETLDDMSFEVKMHCTLRFLEVLSCSVSSLSCSANQRPAMQTSRCHCQSLTVR